MASARRTQPLWCMRLGVMLALVCAAPLASGLGRLPDGVGGVEAGERQLAAAVASELAEGEYLTVGQMLTSPSGRYTAKMQGDGNFCIYLDVSTYQFCTAMDGGYAATEKYAGYKLTMQRDGNLVVSKDKQWVWGSVQSAGYAASKDGEWRAVMQDDGILTVYNVDTVLFRSTPGTIDAAAADARRRLSFPTAGASEAEKDAEKVSEEEDLEASVRRLTAAAARGSSGETALHAAARQGSVGAVRLLLASGSVGVDAVSTDGSTAMHVAAEHGRVDVLQVLLDAKANRVPRNGLGATPLYVAAQHGKPLALELLLAAHGGKDTAASDGSTPLFAAVAANELTAAAALLAAGANPSKARAGGATPLHAACRLAVAGDATASATLVALLLAAGADALAADGAGWRPLHACAAANQAASVAQLLQHGRYAQQLNGQTAAGQTPLGVAAQRGQDAAVAALLAARADTSVADRGGATALYAAAAANQPTTAALLCGSGANKNADRDAWKDGASPLHVASRLGFLAVVQVLVACGADLNAANAKHQTPLFAAAENGHAAVVASLVYGRGYVASIEGAVATPGNGSSAHRHSLLPRLHDRVKANPNPTHATKHFAGVVTAAHPDGTFDVAYDSPGALVNARRVATSARVSADDLVSLEPPTLGGQSWYTNHERRPAVVAGETAPDHAHGDSLGGAGLNVADVAGQTPLYVAAKGGKLAVVGLLCGAGADLDWPESHQRRTPLHAAAAQGQVDVLDRLASAGADANRGDSSRATPLFLAAASGQLEAVQALAESHGADLNRQDASSRTPLDAAAAAGHAGVVRYLVARGARYNPTDQKGALVESFLKDAAPGAAKRSELEASAQAAWAAASARHATSSNGNVHQTKEPPATPKAAAKLQNAAGAADQNYARHQAKKLGDYKGAEATDPQGWATPVGLLLHPFPEGNGYGAAATKAKAA